jgi:hypothetical protein
MSQNGKGDKRRPKSVSYEQWGKNWDKIFRPSKIKKKETKNTT